MNPTRKPPVHQIVPFTSSPELSPGWVLDIRQLGNIDSVSWVSSGSLKAEDNPEDEYIFIIRGDEKQVITLQKNGLNASDQYHIVVIAQYKTIIQYGTLKRGRATTWSETGEAEPVNQKTLEELLKSTLTHLDYVNYVKIKNYTYEDFTGDAWHDVMRKRYIYTNEDDIKTLPNATILDASASYACFAALNKEKVDHFRIMDIPLFWVTDMTTMKSLNHYYPFLIPMPGKPLQSTSGMFLGVEGPVLKEQYFLSTDNNTHAPLITIGHSFQRTKNTADAPFTWRLNSLEHLDNHLYESLKILKRPDEVKDHTFYFINWLLHVFNQSNMPFNLRPDSTERIIAAEKIRFSFKNNQVLWYLHDKGMFIEGLVDKTNHHAMIPIWLDLTSSTPHGFWISDTHSETPLPPHSEPFFPKSSLAAPEALPDLKIYYQSHNNGEGVFITGLGAITSFCQEGEFLYLSSREGVVYLLDRFGNDFVHSLEYFFFAKPGISERLQALLHDKKSLSLIKIRNFYLHSLTHLQQELTVIYSREKDNFYLIAKEKEQMLSHHIVNDAGQLLAWSVDERDLRVYPGIKSETFERNIKKDRDARLYFDHVGPDYLSGINIFTNVMHVELMKDSMVFSSPHVAMISLSLHQEEGKNRATLLFVFEPYFSEDDNHVVDTKIKDIIRLLTTTDNKSLFPIKVVIPEIISITGGGVKGWYHTSEKKGFMPGLDMLPLHSAQVIGMDTKKDFLYACIDQKDIVVIQQQSPGAVKKKLIEARLILPVHDQLLISPLANRSLTVAELSSISAIDGVNMIIIEPSLAGQIIESSQWNDVNIAIRMPTQQSKKATQVTIELPKDSVGSYYMQRAGNNLWIRQYGSQYGLCFLDCLKDDAAVTENNECQFITETGSEGNADHQDMKNRCLVDFIKHYFVTQPSDPHFSAPKIPLTSVFDTKNSGLEEQQHPEFNVVFVKPLADQFASYQAVDILVVAENHDDKGIKQLELRYTANENTDAVIIDTLQGAGRRVSGQWKWGFPAGRITLTAIAHRADNIHKQDEKTFTIPVPTNESVVTINSPRSGAEYNGGERVPITACFQAHESITVKEIGLLYMGKKYQQVRNLNFKSLNNNFFFRTPEPMEMLEITVYMVASDDSITHSQIELYPKRS